MLLFILCVSFATVDAQYISVSGWMDGWMDGWMGGWMDGWMGGWMGGWMDGWMAVPFSESN